MPGRAPEAGAGRPSRPRSQPQPRPLLRAPQVFLTALRAPQPALRYFASERILPLVRLRLADPSGCSYVAAMHRTVFGDESAEGPEGARAEPGAGQLGGPEVSACPAAPK